MMSSKKLVLAILVVLVGSAVGAVGAATISPETLQIYDSKGKLVGTPLPFVNNCTDINFELFGACEFDDPPTLGTAATVAMKYSAGGSFTLNIAEVPFFSTSSNWIPDYLYYVLPNCTSQAYVDTGIYEFPSPGTLTTRVGAIGGGVTGGNPVYLSVLNPPAVELSYHSYSLEYSGCTNSTGEIPNAIAVSPTNIFLDTDLDAAVPHPVISEKSGYQMNDQSPPHGGL